MQKDKNSTTEQIKSIHTDVDKLVISVAADIARLDAGPIAALRRGPFSGAGAAALWYLLAKYNISAQIENSWATLIQAIAILTPKGTSQSRKSAYDPRMSMGAALFNAEVSELRVARLLATTGNMRLDLLLRLCRRLATTDYNRFDVRTLAWFILFGNEETDRKIARDYYRTEQNIRQKSLTTDSQHSILRN